MKIKNLLVGCGCGLPILFVLILVMMYFISGYTDQSRHKEQIIGTYVFDTIRQDQDFFFDEELSHQKIEDYKGVIIKFKSDFTYVINKKVPYFYGNTHGKWKVGWKKDFDCMYCIHKLRDGTREQIDIVIGAPDSAKGDSIMCLGFATGMNFKKISKDF